MSLVHALGQFGILLREHRRGVLLCMLVVLHLTLLAGGGSVVGLMCWFVDVGLFILWQPFVQTERRLNYGNLLLIAAALALGAWLFGWWMLIVWVSVLASLLGGRVMLINHRPTRLFYLLAFAYLIGAVLVWLVPKIVPDPALIGPSLEREFVWVAPLLFLGMFLLPRPQEVGWSQRGIFDFFYSLFIFLLIAVLVLGSLAFMLLEKHLYFEALFRTVFSMAILLLVVAWAWNPRPGFSGVGVFFSQYLLTIGLPFDTWLRRLMDCAEREDDPDRFFKEVCERLLLDLPWVVGGKWSPATGTDAGAGAFGGHSPHRQEYANRSLLLTVYTRHALSPVLVWHLQLLTRLASEYYVAKWRARELQQMSYLQAVHQTGARLTHEIKNLLQSLDNLCYLMHTSGDADAVQLQALLRRQLPQIGERLHRALDKLQAPSDEPRDLIGPGESVAPDAWWATLQQRFAQKNIEFVAVCFDETARLPASLFDSVADNLLHNALIKQLNEGGVRISVFLSPDAKTLRVCDSGSAVGEDLARRLCREPVASESGFGIGLFNAASQAASLGYSLRLSCNLKGNVCLELSQQKPE